MLKSNVEDEKTIFNKYDCKCFFSFLQTMAGLGLLMVVLCVPLTLGQSSLNDLMTLSLLDVDIPESAYHNIFSRGGHGLGSLLSGRSHQQHIGFGRGRTQQGSSGIFGNGVQQQHFSSLNNLGQSQQLGINNNMNLIQQQQQQQQLGIGNTGFGQNQQFGTANTGLIGSNNFASQRLLGSTGNSRLNSLSQHSLLGNTGNSRLNSLSQQSILNNAGSIGQNALSQQSLLGNAGLGGLNQQATLQGVSNTGSTLSSQFGSLQGQGRLSGSLTGLNSGLVRGGNQLQRIGGRGSLRRATTRREIGGGALRLLSRG